MNVIRDFTNDVLVGAAVQLRAAGAQFLRAAGFETVKHACFGDGLL